MAEKSAVTISRKWHQPHIQIDLDVAGISIEMTMADFIDALAHEIAPRVAALVSEGQAAFLRHVTVQAGNPALLFTRDQLHRRMADAFDADVARSMIEALLLGAPVVGEMRQAAEAVFHGMKDETRKIV